MIKKIILTKEEYELLKQIKYYYPNCKKIQYNYRDGFVIYTSEPFEDFYIPYRMLSHIRTDGMVNIDKLIKEYEEVYSNE